MAKIAYSKKKYIKKIENAVKNDLHCKGIALFLGESEDKVCKSIGAVLWKEAMKDVEKRADKWETNYTFIFTTPAEEAKAK